MEKQDSKYRESFLDQLMQNQTRIYAFILSMVRNYQDADDVMQNTVKTLWEKYEESQPINNFVSWGVQVAYYKVLDFRRKKTKSSLQYDDHLFETILSIAAKDAEKKYEDRFEKLNNCLKRLSPRAKELINLRYYQDLKPKQISTLLGLSIANVYKTMSRIHSMLLECVSDS